MASQNVLMIGPFPQDPSNIRGGVQASVYGLALALSKRANTTLKVIALATKQQPKSPAKQAYYGGVDVNYLNLPYKWLASDILNLPKILRAVAAIERPLVHVHGTGTLQLALCAALRMQSIPLVWTMHGITETETLQQFRRQPSLANISRYLMYRSLERTSLRVARHIIVDTPYVRSQLEGVEDRVNVIPQGIFLDEFAAIDDSDRDSNLVLSVGVLSPRKGHHLTIDAFARVKAQLPSARLIIAGVSAKAAYRDSLEQQARVLGLADSVRIWASPSRAQILELMRRARVFALHSEEESQGIALCEALAAGIPIVSTLVGGIPFVVRQGQDGLLMPFGDVAGFADATLRLLTDDTLHSKLSAQGRISSLRFDWNEIAAAVEHLYSVAMRRSGT